MGLYAAYACNEGSGTTITDHSGNGRDMTVSGSGNAWVSGQGSYASAFAGAQSGGGGATWDGGAPLAALSGDVSVMAWYQDLGVSPATQQAFGFGLYTSSGLARLSVYPYRSLSGVAAAPQFTVRDGVPNLYSFGVNGSTADSSWHHVAAVYHATGVFETYLDGALVGTYNAVNPIGVNVRYFALGNTMSASGFEVAVQDLRVFDSALTSADVSAYMSTPVVSTSDPGTGAVTAHKARLSAVGSEGVPGTAAVRAHKARLSAAGSEGVPGTASVRARKARVSGAGAESVPGAGAVTGHKARVAAAHSAPDSGTGAVAARKARVSASGAAVRLAAFPDSAKVVANLLGALAAVEAAYAGPRTLAVIMAGKLPAVRAMRTGGGRIRSTGESDRITDRPLVSVAVFAGDADTAVDLAMQCEQALTSERGITTAYGLIDMAEAIQGAQLVTSPDVTAVQCVTATYRVSMRRPAQ